MARPTPPEPSGARLRAIALLGDLPEDELATLAAQCTWRSYRPRHRIVSRASGDRMVHLVVSGRVRVTAYGGGGREVTFSEVRAGESLGELSAIDGRPRSADVEAIEPTVIASLQPTVFWRLLECHPGMMRKVMVQLATLVRSLSDRVFDLSTLGVQNRVHAEVLRLARAAGVAANRARIAPAPTHVEIANRVSTNREQVTRELAIMEKQGLIARVPRVIHVPDVARLDRLVADVRRGGASGARR